MKNIMKRAHELTKEIKREYPEVDYKTQLGLCLSFLYKEGVDKMIKFKANNGMTVEIELNGREIKNLSVGGVELVKNNTSSNCGAYVTREFIVINSKTLTKKLGFNCTIKIAINKIEKLQKALQEVAEKEVKELDKELNKVRKLVKKYGDIDLKDNFNDFITNRDRF